MIEILFLDLDDTILDFHKAERLAISKTFRSFGLAPTEAVLDRYHVINRQHWEMLERGEITRDQVLTGRFQLLFQEMGIPADPKEVAKCYEHNLGIGHYFLPGATAGSSWPATAPPRSSTADSPAPDSIPILSRSSSPRTWGPTSPPKPFSMPARRGSPAMPPKRP